MSKAGVIFGGIKAFLITKTLGVLQAKIIDPCDQTATCLTLFDILISSIYKLTKQMDKDFEGTLTEARDFWTKAMASWWSLGLSVTLKHVCNQICDYKRIGDYNEEVLERFQPSRGHLYKLTSGNNEKSNKEICSCSKISRGSTKSEGEGNASIRQQKKKTKTLSIG
jgi:hypothetical protein